MPAALLGQVSGEQSTPEIDRELIRETVQSLAATVEREYFDPDMAARVDTSLRRSLAEGRYADTQTPDALARMLTSDLFLIPAWLGNHHECSDDTEDLTMANKRPVGSV